ncbi:MAG: amidase [Chloroflexi bacterium]|nr:amidase [Chloroflexota bacterium]
MAETATALYELTATAALAQMRAGALSPVALVEALLERSASREPEIQAWVRVDADGARAAAGESERAYREGRAGPLAGLPVGVKDIFFTRGLPTSATFAPFRDLQPDIESTAVARLRAAGAIILGKTETTQFAAFDPTRTRNPWSMERTPGGSSSGSAAAVADRMVPAALGSQTVGSTLRPAAYCGVVGFKPSYGRISRFGIIPLAFTLDHPGIIARCVADAALLYGTIAGPDPRDLTTLRRRRPTLRAKPDGAPPALVLLEDFLPLATLSVSDHLLATVDRLAAAGSRVRGARLPMSFEVLRAALHLIVQVEAVGAHARLLPRYREHYGPLLRGFLEVGRGVPGQAYIHAQRVRRRARERMHTLLRGSEVVAMPTASSVAPERSTTGDNAFQGPWSLLGWPSISIPSGLDADGLPVGLQLAAPPYQEARLLRAAQWCEQRLGTLCPPSGT